MLVKPPPFLFCGAPELLLELLLLEELVVEEEFGLIALFTLSLSFFRNCASLLLVKMMQASTRIMCLYWYMFVSLRT